MGQQVITIDNRNSKLITVLSEDTKTHQITKYRAKGIICAIPLAVTRQISFTNISNAKSLIFDNQIRTNCTKSFLILKTPFWRHFASGDSIYSDDHYVNMSHDISPVDTSCGIMVFFHSGNKLDAWETNFGTASKEIEFKR